MVRWSTVDPADDVISKVFADNPGCNVGLRLDQFVVVDCDTMAMAEWWFRNGPPTRFVSRGHFEHRSFWYLIDLDDEVRPSRRPGIDVKTGQGHQCVIPPSWHPTGRPYEWLDLELEAYWDLIPTLSGTTLSALLDQIAPERGPVGDGAGWDVILEGEGRDNFLIGAAGYLRARGFSVAAVRTGLASWNQDFCEPRMSSKDLDRIAKSSGRWDTETTYSFEEID